MDDRPRPTNCPKCGGSRVAIILYGEIPESAVESLSEKYGSISFGGCCVGEGDPEWSCPDCRHRWGSIHFPDLPEDDGEPFDLD